MKKIIKKICLFIGKIFKLFDKIIITPIMKLFIKISELFGKNNKTFEKLFMNKQSLIVVSLVLAFLTFYMVDRNSGALVDNSAEILYSQPVKAIYNEEAYVVEGLPDSVDVILIGRKSDIYLAKQYPNKEGITADLRELSTGTHKVNLKYRQTIQSVDYKIDPSTVTVIIYDKVSDTREVTPELLHRNNLDSKLDISDITLNKTEITIKGSAKKLETVAYVKALVDVDNLVEPTVGKVNINNNKLVAYNNEGKIVDVEILPESVDATLTITSTSKVVPVKVVPVGDIALGYAIETATPNISSITIYGDEDALKTIEYVPVKIDVTNLSSYKEYNVNLEKPSGVRAMSEKTVSVKVNVAKEEQKEISDISVQTINLGEGLKVKALGKENSFISVIVKGSKEALDKVESSNIRATVDLSEYTTPGEYEVDVKVSGDDLKLSYTSKTKKIKVEIYK
ncbi:MAG: CdaR family protein [Erysipelotrichaceae bacterium]|nr:CdaR family protein [Erysipelotrichaceae bacterium]